MITSSSASDLQDGGVRVEVSACLQAVYLETRYLADLGVQAASADGRHQSRSAVSEALLVPGLGHLPASAVLLCMAPAPGTDYPRLFGRQN